MRAKRDAAERRRTVNKAERENVLREIFQEICGDKAKVCRIIMEPPGVGEEYIEHFMIQIEYSGDEDFVSSKFDEIHCVIKERIFGLIPDIPFFEDADDEGILSFGLFHVD